MSHFDSRKKTISTKGNDAAIVADLCKILVRAESHYKTLSKQTDSSQLRRFYYQFAKQQRAFINLAEARLITELSEVSVSASASASELFSCSPENEPDDTIKREKQLLKLIKSRLKEANEQPIRNWLSSMAASVQIGLDEAEQLQL